MSEGLEPLVATVGAKPTAEHSPESALRSCRIRDMYRGRRGRRHLERQRGVGRGTYIGNGLGGGTYKGWDVVGGAHNKYGRPVHRDWQECLEVYGCIGVHPPLPFVPSDAGKDGALPALYIVIGCGGGASFVLLILVLGLCYVHCRRRAQPMVCLVPLATSLLSNRPLPTRQVFVCAWGCACACMRVWIRLCVLVVVPLVVVVDRAVCLCVCCVCVCV